MEQILAPLLAIWTPFVSILEQILLVFALLTGSIGIGVILFTILTRLLILPLTLKAIQSSRKMQEVQPLLKEIQRKYGKDQKKLQEETVRLYKEYKINPVGGCLPLLLQFPIFIGVYQAIIHLMHPDQQQYLGSALQTAIVENNTQPLLDQPVLGVIWQMLNIENGEALVTVLREPFLGINLGLAPFSSDFSEFNGIIYLILPVLSIVLQFTQQLMAMPRVQDQQQKTMMQVMMFMPLFLGYIAMTFPAGAVLYWVTSSVVGIVQQYFTSGWGSLANHLKFLPPDTRARQPSLALSAAGAGAGGESGSVSLGADHEPGRQTFWDVLRPLTESTASQPEHSQTDGSVAAAQEDRPSDEAAAADQRPRQSQQASPRRPRGRRRR